MCKPRCLKKTSLPVRLVARLARPRVTDTHGQLCSRCDGNPALALVADRQKPLVLFQGFCNFHQSHVY